MIRLIHSQLYILIGGRFTNKRIQHIYVVGNKWRGAPIIFSKCKSIDPK